VRVPETPEGLLQPLPMQPLHEEVTFSVAHTQVQPFQPGQAYGNPEFEAAYGAQLPPTGPLDYSQPTGFELPSGCYEELPYDFATVPGFQGPGAGFDDCANYGAQFWS